MRLFEGNFVALANSEGKLDSKLIPQLVEGALISPERLGCNQEDRQETKTSIIQSQLSRFPAESFLVRVTLNAWDRAFS